MTKSKELISLSDAFNQIAESLIKKDSIHIGSFRDFVENIWSEGYIHKHYFKFWHVGYIADKCEETLKKNKHLVAILPRYHFKSTILGYAFTLWRLLSLNTDASMLYVSYNQTMADYHLSEIKKIIRRNHTLRKWLIKDLTGDAKTSFRYLTVNGNYIEVFSGGMFSFKRGMHVNAGLVADDIMKDPDNPLALGEIEKVKDHFFQETIFIPTRGVPVVVLGTPMTPGDLLATACQDERFDSIVLPAFDPVPGRRVLMPELYDETYLKAIQKQKPAAFASEFLLTPHYSTDGYFSHDELLLKEDSELQNFSISQNHRETLKDYDYVVAGFDVGKRKHPSHLAIFGKKDKKVHQICSAFFDGWEYDRQAKMLNEVAFNFRLDRGIIDGTGGSMADRSLDREWELLIFTHRSKNQMAQNLETFMLASNFTLLKDDRQHEQILAVTRELRAAETPTGHGDAFFSMAMAILAASSYEDKKTGVFDSGNIQDLIKNPNQKGTSGLEKWYNNDMSSNPTANKECPSCKVVGGFIEERNLCLICRWRM